MSNLQLNWEVMNCNPSTYLVSFGYAQECVGFAGMLGQQVWQASEYGALEGCAALLDVVSLVGVQ
jgi:hypothetical protein